MRFQASRLGQAAGVVLLAVTGIANPAGAQDSLPQYPTKAPLGEYMMPARELEIALARSAAPESVSRDATVLVLGKTGYETAVEGSNGFVCLVERGWNGPFDWPEYWNPKIRAAACLNPQAARSILPISKLRTRLVLEGRTSSEILSAVRLAYETGELPALEGGAMSYMMGQSAYLTDQGGHNGSHVMFYAEVSSEDWGANTAGSPFLASPYWFFSPQDEAQVRGLPTLMVFLTGVPNWSDGSPAEPFGS